MNSNPKLTVIELRNYIEARGQFIANESELILHAAQIVCGKRALCIET